MISVYKIKLLSIRKCKKYDRYNKFIFVKDVYWKEKTKHPLYLKMKSFDHRNVLNFFNIPCYTLKIEVFVV